MKQQINVDKVMVPKCLTLTPTEKGNPNWEYLGLDLPKTASLGELMLLEAALKRFTLQVTLETKRLSLGVSRGVSRGELKL